MEVVYALIYAACVGAGVFVALGASAYLDLPRGWKIFFMVAFAYSGFSAASWVIQRMATRRARQAELRREARRAGNDRRPTP